MKIFIWVVFEIWLSKLGQVWPDLLWTTISRKLLKWKISNFNTMRHWISAPKKGLLFHMRENSSLADIRKKRQKGIVMASLSIYLFNPTFDKKQGNVIALIISCYQNYTFGSSVKVMSNIYLVIELYRLILFVTDGTNNRISPASQPTASRV